MNQKKLERIIWIICGILLIIFILLCVKFSKRKKAWDEYNNATEVVDINSISSEKDTDKNSDGNKSEKTSKRDTSDNKSSKKGEPIEFGSNDSQSLDGDWLFCEGNQLVDKDGKKVWLTGINWFGYNTGTNCFDGLWACDLDSSIDAIADHGFNLLRIPISTELLLQWKNGEYPTANFNQATNSYLVGMNSYEIFNHVVDKCRENGIKIMLDVHCAKTDASGHNVNLWTNGDIDEQDFIDAWVWVAEQYADDDTIIAFDLENEPHGKPFEEEKAIWNDSDDANNWPYVATKTAKAIFEKNPNVLIVVEGLEIYPMDIDANGDYHSTDENDYYFSWWGGNLRGVKDYPIDLGEFSNKLVYSPHDYGPTVYNQPWFYDGYDYDSLMEDCWHDNWFFIYEDNTAPILIGEWGGYMTEPNITWMTYLRELIGNYHLNYTFWCFNSNSGDTGGLVLDDFTTWDDEKYEFVKEVLWQQDGKFVGLDHETPLGKNGICLDDAEYENW